MVVLFCLFTQLFPFVSMMTISFSSFCLLPVKMDKLLAQFLKKWRVPFFQLLLFIARMKSMLYFCVFFSSFNGVAACFFIQVLYLFYRFIVRYLCSVYMCKVIYQILVVNCIEFYFSIKVEPCYSISTQTVHVV